MVEETRESPNVAGLLASGSFSPLPFPHQLCTLEACTTSAVDVQRFVPGYSGDHRGGFAPPSLFTLAFAESSAPQGPSYQLSKGKIAGLAKR